MVTDVIMLQVLPELGEEQRVVLLQGEQAFHCRLGQSGQAGESLSTLGRASPEPSSPSSPTNTGLSQESPELAAYPSHELDAAKRGT